MTDSPNKLFLGVHLEDFHDDDKEVMVDVDHVSMIFNMASERMSSLKEYAIALARRELRFKEFRALNDVTFQVKRGDVFGVLGTNGSGKSTILKIIAGVLDPSEGSCTTKGNIAPLIELGAGFDMDLTARENIYLNGALLGYTKDFIESHFDDIVQFAEIEKFLDMPLKNYSSGMVARIAFAVATATIPDILIVDEVLSVGDFMFQQKCERRITSLIKDHQVTVLFVSHDTNQIERLCNKAIWIEKSHVRMIGAAHDVCETYRMIGGREGSPESEAHMLAVENDGSVVPLGELTDVVAGDSRYGTAIDMARRMHPQPDKVIIVRDDSRADNMLGIELSRIMEAPLLPIAADLVPDAVLDYLNQLQPSEIIILGSSNEFRRGILDSFALRYADAKVTILEDERKDLLALKAYRYATEQSDAWGRTAFLSYKECFEDLLVLSPYMYAIEAPLFFVETQHTVDAPVREAIVGNFDRLIAVGNDHTEIFEDCLDPFREAGMEVLRLVGNDVYHANRLLNEWMIDEYHKLGIAPSRSVAVSASLQREHAFTLGSYAGLRNMLVLYADPVDLDSIAAAIDYLQTYANDIDELVFIGNDQVLSSHDRQLLEKALLIGKAGRKSAIA